MLSTLATPIVTAGRCWIGMAGHFLHCDDIGPGIQQVTDEGAAKVVRREPRHPSLPGPLCDVKGCGTKKGIELRDTF